MKFYNTYSHKNSINGFSYKENSSESRYTPQSNEDGSKKGSSSSSTRLELHSNLTVNYPEDYLPYATTARRKKYSFNPIKSDKQNSKNMIEKHLNNQKGIELIKDKISSAIPYFSWEDLGNRRDSNRNEFLNRESPIRDNYTKPLITNSNNISANYQSFHADRLIEEEVEIFENDQTVLPDQDANLEEEIINSDEMLSGYTRNNTLQSNNYLQNTAIGHRILMLNSDRSTATLASLQHLDAENNLNDIQGGITNQAFIGLHSCYGYPKCENINCGNCGKSRLTTNISDTSNLSWFSLNNQSKEYFSFGCCAILTTFIFILLAIISVVGISIHLGFLTNQNKSNVLPLSGHLKIKSGDSFNDQLFNSSSKEYQIKTTKYEAILKSAMQAGSIEDSVVNTEVYAFRAGSLIIFFRIYLDRRKLFNNYETRLLPNVNHKLIGLDSLEAKKINEKDEDWLVKLVHNRLKYGISQLNLIGSENLKFELDSIFVSLNYTDPLLNSKEDNFVNEKLLGDRVLGSRSDIDSDRHLNSIENKNQFLLINKKDPLLKNVGSSFDEQKEKALLKNKNSEIFNYSSKHNSILNSEKSILVSTSTTTMLPLKTTKSDIVEIFTNTPAYTMSNIRQSVTVKPIIQRFNALNLSNTNSLYEKYNNSSSNLFKNISKNNFNKTSLTPNNILSAENSKNTSSLLVSSNVHENKLPFSTLNTTKNAEVITTPKTILLNSTKSWFMYKTRKTTLSFLEDFKPFSTNKKNNLFNDMEKNDWTTFQPNYNSSKETAITQKPDSLSSKATTIESILSSFLRLRHQKSNSNKTKVEKNLLNTDQAAESSSNFINLHEVMTGGFSPSPIIPGHNNTAHNKDKFLSNNLSLKNSQNNLVNSFIPPNHKPLPSTSVHFSSMDFGQWRPVSPLKQKSDLFSMFKTDNNTSKNRLANVEKFNSNANLTIIKDDTDFNSNKTKSKNNNIQIVNENLDTTTTSSIYSLSIKPKQGLRPINPSVPLKAYAPPTMVRQHAHKRPTSINKNNFNQHININRNLMPSSSNNPSNNRKPMNNLLMNNDNLQFGLRPNLQNNNNMNKNNWLLNNPKADRHVPLFGQPLSDTSLESIDPMYNFNNPLTNFDDMSSFLRREDNDNTETTLPPSNLYRESRTNFKKDFDKEFDFEKLFKLNDDFESLKLNKTNIKNKVGLSGNNFIPPKSTLVPMINRFQKRIGIVNREFMDDQYFKVETTTKEPFKTQNIAIHQTSFNTIDLNKNNEIQTNTIEKINNLKAVENIKNDLIRLEKNNSIRSNDKFITNLNKKTTPMSTFNEDLRLSNYNDDIDLTGELLKFNQDGILETTTETKNLTSDKIDFKLTTRPIQFLATTEISIKLKSFNAKNESLKTQCDSLNQFTCADGIQCIDKSKKCNYKIDCKDRSDESSCTCADYLSKLNPRKICDSVLDCADYSDEINCDYCRLGNSNDKTKELNPENVFICSHAKSCISKEKICDGIFDCPNGADEEFCVSLADENDLMKNTINLDLHRSTAKTYQKEGALVIRKNGLWAPLCLENSDVFASSFGPLHSTDSAVEFKTSELLNEAKSSNNNLKGFNEDVLQSENGDLLVANSNIATNSAVFSTSSYQDINRPTSRVDKVKNSKHMSKKNFEKEANFNWQLDELGRAVCSIQSFNELESVNVTSLKEINSSFSAKTSGIKYFSMDQLNILFKNNAKWGNLFKADVCLSGKIAKISCKDFECGVRPSASNVRRRIIGGQSSRPASWPWQVALYREGEFQCGGVLIGHQWILSAAHCFHSSRTSYWTARLGILRRGNNFENPFEQILRITHIIIHPGYVDKGFLNDIVLLKLEKSVKYSDYVRPLCLPDANEDINLYHGKLCSIVGWGKLFEAGRIFPDTLQELKLPVISTSECRRRTMFLPLYKITDGMFCAGGRGRGRDACLGDSGGPLMCPTSNGKWSLLGITSNGDGCGRPGRPGVYTKVSSYVIWIEQEISKPRSLIQVDNDLLENYYNKDIISELTINSSNITKNNFNSDLVLTLEEKKALMDQNIRNFDKNSRTDTSNLRIAFPFKNLNESTTRRVAKLLKERKLPSFIEEGEVISICSGWRCPLGKCLNMTQICDGHIECLDASDESNC